MTRPSAGSYDCRTRVGVLFAAVVVRTSERDLTPIDGAWTATERGGGAGGRASGRKSLDIAASTGDLGRLRGRMKMPPVLLRVLIAPRDDLESLSQYVIGARLRSPGDATGCELRRI
jgi:hypothetical protein